MTDKVGSAPSGTGSEADVVSELEEFAQHAKANRAEYVRRLDEDLKAGRITQQRYADGLKIVNDVKPSAGRKAFEKARELTLEHLFTAVLSLLGIVSIEALVAHLLLEGVHFFALFAYFLPLTVAAVLIAWALTSGEFGLGALLVTAVILLAAAWLQNKLPGKHLTLKHVLCSPPPPGPDGLPPPNAGNCTGLVSIVDYIAEVTVGYWRAFGPAAFLACVGVGGAFGFATALIAEES